MSADLRRGDSPCVGGCKRWPKNPREGYCSKCYTLFVEREAKRQERTEALRLDAEQERLALMKHKLKQMLESRQLEADIQEQQEQAIQVSRYICVCGGRLHVRLCLHVRVRRCAFAFVFAFAFAFAFAFVHTYM